MENKVYVAYKSNTYEGCSEPLAVFDRIEFALIFKSGSEVHYQRGVEIKELEINKVPTT
jgi:hypothetical protein